MRPGCVDVSLPAPEPRKPLKTPKLKTLPIGSMAVPFLWFMFRILEGNPEKGPQWSLQSPAVALSLAFGLALGVFIRFALGVHLGGFRPVPAMPEVPRRRRTWGFGFRVWGLGFRGLGFRVWGLGFRI